MWVRPFLWRPRNSCAISAQPTISRCFNWDGYNVSRVDIQRGANSILFGNGSGAGIINSATDDATIGLNRAVVTARYGIYGSIRGSLNFSYGFNGELAVHGALLDDKKYYRQDPSYNHSGGLFLGLVESCRRKNPALAFTQ
jgi:outer membrane receptor protein involved in Fe transport